MNLNVRLDDLKAALKAEGIEVPDGTLERIFRKLTNPDGCEFCGQHVKVGIYVTPSGRVAPSAGPNRKYVTACCRKEI